MFRATLAADSSVVAQLPGALNGPMRNIALVSSRPNWGGGEEQMRILVHGLRDRGHRVTVLARRDGVLADYLAADGFEVIGFPGRGRNLRALRRIRGELRRIQPDVLFYNDSHAMTGVGFASIGLLIPARIAARRCLFPIHSPWTYKVLTDRVVCVSQAVAEICCQGGIAAERIRVVYDGVDPKRMRKGDRHRGRRALDIVDRQRLIVTVAKLANCKGHTYLLHALPTVLQRHPEVVAAFAGDGELTEPLRAEARRLGIEGQIRFLGFRHDVPDLIQAADLVVLPSHTEGLCSTLMDAMFAGRPIVTTTAGGIPEVTGADEPGAEQVAWSVPPRDAVALSEAILEALDQPEKASLFAARGSQRAERLFTKDRMVEATLEVCEELLPEHATGKFLPPAKGAA